MTDLRQSEKYGKYLESLGWVIESYINNGNRHQIFVKRIPFIGSVIKFQRVNLPIPFEWAWEVAKRYKALFVKIEPDVVFNDMSRGVEAEMQEHGYQLDNWPLLPPKTITLDISKSEEGLISGMEKDTRYCVRKSLENGLDVEIFNNVFLGSEKRATPAAEGASVSEPSFIKGSLDFARDDTAQLVRDDNMDSGQARMTGTPAIEDFIKLWGENAKRKGFWVPFEKEITAMWNAFSEDAFLIFSRKHTENDSVTVDSVRRRLSHGEMINKGDAFQTRYHNLSAGGLFLKSGETLHYMHAGTTIEGRDLLAPYRVIWEAIKLGKQIGCTRLDFEGISDERYKKLTKKWHGFTHFKKGFGGEEVTYVGSFIKFRNPLFKYLFKIGA